MAIRFPKCCTPLPGDDIIGYVTRGRGVTIHRKDCVNILNIPDGEEDRLVEAGWELDEATSPGSRYIVEIVVYAENRSGLLTDISKKFSDENIDIISLSTNTDSKGRVTMRISFETASRSDMDRLCDKVRSVQNVTDVRRPE